MLSTRKQKRRRNCINKAYHVGSYVISCSGHPSIVTSKDDFTMFNQKMYIFEGSYETKSLIDSRIDSCSIYHCPLVEISKSKAEELAHDKVTMTEYDYDIKHHGLVYADKIRHYRQTGEWIDQ